MSANENNSEKDIDNDGGGGRDDGDSNDGSSSPKSETNDPNSKRKIADDDPHDDGEDQEENEQDLDPEQSSQPNKKRKIIPFEKIYLDNLPQSDAYERSYMHRDTIKFVLVARNTHFIITASIDGHIKFWKKKAIGIEFVKHFRAHLGTIVDMSINNPLGSLLATISDDRSLKIFDIINFDMINMNKLEFKPGCVEWCYTTMSTSGVHDPFPVIAVSDSESNRIYTFEATSTTNQPLQILDRIHISPVVRMRFNPSYSTMVSVDQNGMLDYWSTHRNDYRFPSQSVKFESKMDTDLYVLARCKQIPHDISFSLDGQNMVMICSDRKIRLFRFLTGKMIRVYDESLQSITLLQQNQPQLPNMEFGRRMAIERDLEKSESFRMEKICFDDSGYYIIYPTMLGIKILNWYTNKLVKMIGKGENFRPLSLGLHQQIADLKTTKSILTPEMITANNPTLEQSSHSDPTIFSTGFRKNRFYLFTKREPDDSAINSSEDSVLTGLERDVFNEKPSREDMIAATSSESSGSQKLSENVIIHTTMGDIQVKLFAKDCPKTVENFVTHSRNGYYNNHIFHRVIRQFMIQTGDPTGTGTGGTSIWGREFSDEIVSHLKHDKPFTLSMANAGPNTNGSQFFITVIATPWLDGKHTVFGRVTKGMEVIQAISQVRTNPKTDKPYDDIKILNIQVK
ncbi:peptidylprolyl isomerase domain and WD repeat-containing protein 1 [Dermatophagoides pteronyssinus]|uniref:peptidylprolyl isomerase domain and WD repeat-containing protein 1 n=1 Tax=Dermatophagoides pteronyssinus TaxID=6956 RepID=UPI003F67F983